MATEFCWFQSTGVSGRRRLVARPGGLKLFCALRLVSYVLIADSGRWADAREVFRLDDADTRTVGRSSVALPPLGVAGC